MYQVSIRLPWKKCPMGVYDCALALVGTRKGKLSAYRQVQQAGCPNDDLRRRECRSIHNIPLRKSIISVDSRSKVMLTYHNSVQMCR